ncbi:MAG: transglutaminase domain-containing protein [Methanobacteriota archaeon]
MKRLSVVAVTAVLLAVSIAGTGWALSTEPERNPGDSVAFAVPVSEPLAPAAAPLAAGYTPASFQFGVDVETHGIYVGYGGALRVRLNNSRSDSEMHVVKERIVWLGGIVEKDVSVEVGARAVSDLGLVWLPGPNFEGDQSYKVSLEILVKQGSSWKRLGDAGDQWTDFQPGSLPVIVDGTASEYERGTNCYAYYDRANALIEDRAQTVAAALAEATSGMPGDLTYERLCGVYDWVSHNIAYVSEPEGEDDWQTPEETLASGGGDCEDFTLLISDMVLEMGGTPRMYLIDEHAFAAIWVGESTAAAEDAINGYYGAELKLAFIEDGGGFWVVADPLGSLHLGGLAVRSEPTSSTVWDFTDTAVLYGIDMTRAPGSVRIWEQDRLWGIFQIVCDVLFLAAILMAVGVAPRPVCARCGRKFSGEIMECKACGALHHPHCASQGFCANCGASFSAPQPLQPSSPPPPTLPPRAPL